ncbi:MAG: orotidine-5'-phosphate decarboxylase [Chloroflexota bacterium]
MGFLESVAAARQRNDSALCIGLDPLPELLPVGPGRDAAEAVLAFNRAIVEATSDLVCAYKPNLAFYEALGPRGWWVLRETIRSIPRDIPGSADAKRGDIGSSAERYAAALFDELGCAACTVSPYMGQDSVAPFTAGDRFAFVLCHTSNPGAGAFQELEVQVDGTSLPLYEVVAQRVAGWSPAGHYGLVAGATYPPALSRISAAAPDLMLLIPGLGTQGGEAGAALGALGPHARARAVVTVSRHICYAPAPDGDTGAAVRRAAKDWRTRLNTAFEATTGPARRGQ